MARHAEKLHNEAQAMLKAIKSGPHPERLALFNWNADFRTLECAFDDQCSVYIQDSAGVADLKLSIARMEAQIKLYNDIFKGNYCKTTSK